MERLILALTLALAAAPAAADVARGPARTAIADYVRGRAADDFGELDVAAASFAAAYRAQPDDRMLALRTLRQAVAAGDMPLALRTAHALDTASALPPDGTILLFGEAVADRNWRRASTLADRVEQQRLFGFVVPVMRAWIGYAQHRADPAGLVDAAQATPLTAAYAAEHRVLLLLAGDDPAAGASALSALKLPDGARAARLRIAAAAALAKRDRREAAAMLVGEDPAIARAREILARDGRLPGAIDTAQAGLAELFVRVAADVNRGQAASLALEFARVATLLAPQDSATWLVTAELLAGAGDTDAGLDALSHVPAGDPFAGAARDARLTLLVRAGRAEEALAEAKTATEEQSADTADWARYGDLLVNRDQYGPAATAYAKALSLAGDAPPPAVAWPLLLQQAAAQQQAGDWTAAQATGRRALAVAPEQPAVLNFVGYSELDRGGDVAGATALIAKASTLAPDDPAITDSLGWSWYRRGDVARAIPLLERAARGAPAESDINDHLGDAYWRAGRRFEAVYAWRAALVAADPKDTQRIRAKIDGDRTPPPAG